MEFMFVDFYEYFIECRFVFNKTTHVDVFNWLDRVDVIKLNVLQRFVAF